MTDSQTVEDRKALVRASNGATTGGGEAVAAAQPRARALARALLADGEVVLLSLKPSVWFIPLVSAPVVALGIIVVLVQRLPAVSSLCGAEGGWLCSVGWWIIGLRLAWSVLQWYCRSYILTDRRVIRQKGVLTQTVFECRLDRLQNTFVARTVVQRLLGIGTILFATAGTGQVEAMWQHVSHAAEVHRKITEAAEKFRSRGGGGPAV